MRGRKPKPTALKILEGNPGKRPLNKDEPNVNQKLPKCPKWLNAKARSYWKEYAKELNSSGLLSTVDKAAFTVFCQALAMMEKMEAEIERNGAVLYDPEDGYQKNPAFNVLKDSWNTVKAMAIEFGITPSGRSRVKVSKKEKVNPLSELLNRKRNV